MLTNIEFQSSVWICASPRHCYKLRSELFQQKCLTTFPSPHYSTTAEKKALFLYCCEEHVMMLCRDYCWPRPDERRRGIKVWGALWGRTKLFLARHSWQITTSTERGLYIRQRERGLFIRRRRWTIHAADIVFLYRAEKSSEHKGKTLRPSHVVLGLWWRVFGLQRVSSMRETVDQSTVHLIQPPGHW